MSLCMFYANRLNTKRGQIAVLYLMRRGGGVEECVIEKSVTVGGRRSAVEILLLCHHPPSPAADGEERGRGKGEETIAPLCIYMINLVHVYAH